MHIQRDLFRSQRLAYRAVRIPEDNDLFDAINDDRIGYANSNASNIKLPGTKDARKWQKQVAEESLLGAVICLLPEESIGAIVPEGEDSGVESLELRTASRIAPTKYGTAIGQLTLKGLPPPLTHHRNTELAIDILPMYQAHGYGGEAIRWALHYAFHLVGLHRVTIRAFEWNEGALRLYERLGFVVEGRQREALWHEGRWWDGVEMGMLDREWKRLHGGNQ
ncbi:acyl-CoA N-acyltransferase [Lojkania enalia]|uniref:Acyl-CoA N-acyltransferase n=1 Tax=Lojkania enalia TaxID=147567 RepID=A0A9P4KIG5_9PLEO|nr:acyl-CoA N-acyltransferase [Didymosphaeria enalia]